MDVLTEVLNTLRLKSTVYCRSELSGIWSLHFAATSCATFHVVDSGGCWLSIEGETPRLLTARDVLVLPRGTAHTLAYAPHAPPDVTIELDDGSYGVCHARRYGTGENPLTLICGTFDVEAQDGHPLLGLLPPLLHIRDEPRLSAALHLLAVEARVEQAGRETVVTRLADVLLIQVIRWWVAHQPAHTRGWLAALHDPQVSAALHLIHSEPSRGWRVGDLAAAVALSRSAFAERFAALVGEPPIQYLTRWRLWTAARLLHSQRLPLAEVARRVGYESEFAFNRAFKQQFGVPPGVYRRAALENGESS